MEKLKNVTRYGPRNPKAVKNQVPDVNRILTMKEKMINSFLILLTKATPVKCNPHLLRLSTVRILHKAVVLKMKTMQRGAFTFPMLRTIGFVSIKSV
jgi:hypothetical protein